MTTLTPAQLAEIEARANAATRGPWECDGIENEGEYGVGDESYSGFTSYEVMAETPLGWKSVVDTSNSGLICVEVEYGGEDDGGAAWDEVGKRNAEFIAHARQDIPALIAHARALEAERDALRAECERLMAENAKLRTVNKFLAHVADVQADQLEEMSHDD